tara:strand:+ start:60 stop:464 length:405 start_codon:yes stop_codon:yes gene_type:complete
MSTSYQPSSYIKLDDLKALTKVKTLGDVPIPKGIVEVKTNHKNELGDIVNYVKDGLGNYLLFYLWDRKGAEIDTPDYITGFERFGLNNPDLIIDIIEEHTEVDLVDEHRNDGKDYERASIDAYDFHQETLKEGK